MINLAEVSRDMSFPRLLFACFLVLESDEKVAEAMDEYYAESQLELKEPADLNSLAANDGGGKMEWITSHG